VINFLFGSVVACFFLMTVAALFHLRWTRRLPLLKDLPGRDGELRGSVVIAARNEEARIERTIRHLLAQSGVALEIIVVDDRSTDRTSELLERLAKEDPRVRWKRIDVLPEDWLGKCHACHVGASMATGDWILFTDADCWLKPDVIDRAWRVAKREGADHITLTPGLAVESVSVQAWYLMYLVSLLNWIAGVNRNRPGAHLGLGAFNLVRASAYRECGGYEALRLTILDDVRLGRLLERCGKRTRAFLGGDDVECHWGTTLRDMVRVMEKNYFAAVNFKTSSVLIGCLFLIFFLGMILFGVLSKTALGLAATVSPLLLVLPGVILARRLGGSWRPALLVPLMLLVVYYALFRSTFLTLRQGGVRWRDTFYSLAKLRERGVK
jgi:glycosyltransferase involved in cell wall biosynthesis